MKPGGRGKEVKGDEPISFPPFIHTRLQSSNLLHVSFFWCYPNNRTFLFCLSYASSCLFVLQLCVFRW